MACLATYGKLLLLSVVAGIVMGAYVMLSGCQPTTGSTTRAVLPPEVVTTTWAAYVTAQASGRLGDCGATVEYGLCSPPCRYPGGPVLVHGGDPACVHREVDAAEYRCDRGFPPVPIMRDPDRDDMGYPLS